MDGWMDGWLDVDRCRGFLRVSVDGFWCLLQCCLTQMPKLLTIPATFCCRAPWTYTLPPEIFLKDLCLIGRPSVFFCSFRHPKQWRLGCSRVHCLAGLLGSSEIYRSNLQKAGEVLGPMGVEAGWLAPEKCFCGSQLSTMRNDAQRINQRRS